MLIDTGWWHKLWDKGVDITAGVAINTISAAIIAVIATWTWRWKRKRDLKLEEDKQHQQWRIAEELDKKKRIENDSARVAALKEQLEPLIDGITRAGAGSIENAQRLQDAWAKYVKWLEQNQLQYLPGNQKIHNEILDEWEYQSQQALFGWAGWAMRLSAAVSQTQLI